jgi:hypothetical protein
MMVTEGWIRRPFLPDWSEAYSIVYREPQDEQSQGNGV